MKKAKKTVQQIIMEQGKRYRSEKRRQMEQEGLRCDDVMGELEGLEANQYRKMPSPEKMRFSLSQLHSNKKYQILREMAQGEKKMEGMLNVKQKKLKDRTIMEGRAAYGA